MSAVDGGLDAALVGFCRLLRERGVACGPDRLIRYRRALGALDPTALEDLYWAGRACLLQGRADVAVYDRAFAEWFLGGAPASPGAAPPGAPEPAPPPERGGDTSAGTRQAVRRERLTSGAGAEDAGDGGEPASVGAVASSVEVLRAKAFPTLTPAEEATLRELLRRLRPRLPLRMTRRTLAARSGRRLDLRRSVRRSLRTQGEIVDRHWRRRRTEPRTVVLLLDVSGSMTSYSRALLQFAHSLARSGGRVEVFCFGTRLTRVTEALRDRDPDAALARAAARVLDWDGGTRIGASLRELVRAWGRQSFLRGAVVLICSDGLERGDPALLAEQMARLRRLVHRIVWVNPLKGDPDFEPASRGMRAALPYVDDLVAGDTLDSLERLAGRLAPPRLGWR
jgi:uncharacterized protein with von Willebrand factor type A (vWA) domain